MVFHSQDNQPINILTYVLSKCLAVCLCVKTIKVFHLMMLLSFSRNNKLKNCLKKENINKIRKGLLGSTAPSIAGLESDDISFVPKKGKG